MTVRRFIITGGPGTGKSTLINALEQKGYLCFHEVSRIVIREQNSLEKGILPWDNLLAFSDLVFQRMVEQYEISKKKKGIYFFDRALPDILAYLKNAGIPIPEKYYYTFQKYSFESYVFIAPPWAEIYTNDPERPQSYEESEALDHHLRLTYDNLGYDLVNLPKSTVEERVNFTLNFIRTINKTLPKYKMLF